MKKFTVLVALALLAATGTSYAVTCAYDNVPGSTLLVPYFKVSRNGAGSGSIPEGGVDTLVALTNVSEWGVIAHITVWNKQSAPVLDFNVPMTGYDVAFFRMKDILNGSLNVNPNTQKLWGGADPCKSAAFIGDAQDLWIRFQHPEFPGGDYFDSIGFYATPAFSGNFRNRIWDSLDQSADYLSLVTRPSNDGDNPACGVPSQASDGAFTGDFSGYLTIDVVNYCTNYFPNQYQFYTGDAIATRGWDGNGGPNVLMGDIFFIDPAAAAGNISGEVAIALEFDVRLEAPADDWTVSPYKTFYARYSTQGANYVDPAGAGPDPRFAFSGDGREPLGTAYAFRYLNDEAAGLTTWATVWRGDLWDADDSSATLTAPSGVNLCQIARNGRQITISTWDNDENQNEQTGGGPSGDIPVTNNPFVWWEANRIIITGNNDMNPAGFNGGWTRWTFNSNNDPRYHQAWVGVQHTAPGAFVSVGHSATLVDHEFLCPGGLGFWGAVPGNLAFGALPVVPAE